MGGATAGSPDGRVVTLAKLGVAFDNVIWVISLHLIALAQMLLLPKRRL